MVPERIVFDVMSRHYQRRISDMDTWGFDPLNRKSCDDFERTFRGTGFHIASFRRNVGYSAASTIFAAIGEIPSLKRHFTQNVFCTLENP